MAEEEGSLYKVEYLDGGDEETKEFNWVARAGRAKVRYDSGSVYEGDFNEEKMKDGKGKFTWMQASEEEEETKEIASYEGEYKAGKRCGQGVMIYPNGDIYSGEWLDSKMHGLGTYKYKKSDDVYSGEFVQGIKEGKGIYEFGKDESRLDGIWEKGTFKSGEWQFKGAGKFEGSFQKGQPLGPGCFTFTTGIAQHGEYKSNSNQEKENEEEQVEEGVPPQRTWHGAPLVCA